MRLKVRDTGFASGPSETVVLVTTAEGTVEEVIVDQGSIERSTIEVGFPVAGKDDQWLIELPRETMRGRWRVWVSKDQLVPAAEHAA
jgi:hypothetical protein